MTNLRKWQIIGAVGIVVAYVCFVLASRYHTNWAWAGWAAMFVVGIAELVVIFYYDSTITRFVRNIAGTTWDRIILFALIPITWALAGELAAGFFLLGLLNSHMHEHE